MFEVGRLYNRRRDVHARFGGQQQGGISTPRGLKGIFIFTGPSGETHGYRDEFRDDGTFWYTGEGQSGDMVFVRGNRAIRDHRADGKHVYLFEEAGPSVRFIGQVAYLSHHLEQRVDSSGRSRQAIIFELELLEGADDEAAGSPDTGQREPKYWSLPIAELRTLAHRAPPSGSDAHERRTVLRQRSQAVKTYVLRRSKGCCEACGSKAPFMSKERRPYLEAHHILRLCDGGPDLPGHVAGLCPNCHREAHYGVEGQKLNQQLLSSIQALEQSFN